VANTLAAWGLYSMLGVSAATGVGIATGTIPLGPFDGIEQSIKGLFDDDTTVASLPPEQQIPQKQDQQSGDKVAPAIKSDEEKAKAEKPALPQGPAFDILRVEKDGSVVVAGRAPANSKVDLLLSDGKVVGTGKAGESGDFVIILDEPLKPGDYTMVLRSKREGEDATNSKEVATVHIPKTSDGEVLALVTEDGEASRIIIKPQNVSEPKPEPVAEAASKIVETPVVPKEVQEAGEKEINEPETVASVEPVEVVKPETQQTNDAAELPKTEPVPASPDTVVVEAVEIENGTLFIAGAVRPGATVRVYLNNKSLGTVRGTSDGRFLLQKKYDLQEGRHVVRADVLNRSTGETVARAEVPLVHEPVVVAKVEPKKPVEPQPSAPEPKPSTAVTSEADVVENTYVQQLETDTPAAPASDNANVEIAEDDAEEEDVIRTGSSIIIKPGDNLWRISRKTYGQGIRYTTIYNANRDQIRDPSRIYIGQIFKIPKAVVQ